MWKIFINTELKVAGNITSLSFLINIVYILCLFMIVVRSSCSRQLLNIVCCYELE